MNAVYCPKCGSKMPVEAKFCGLCGTPIKESTGNKEEITPIWELFEPNAYIVYMCEYPDEKIWRKFKIEHKVMDIENGIIEFERRHTRFEVANSLVPSTYKDYCYTGLDRRYWVPSSLFKKKRVYNI